MNDEYMFGVEEGEVRDVPSLQAPGFIKAQADGNFNDVSSAISGDLILRVRSNTPEYPAFRVSFGALFSREFKAKFSVPEGEEFSEAVVPTSVELNGDSSGVPFDGTVALVDGHPGIATVSATVYNQWIMLLT